MTNTQDELFSLAVAITRTHAAVLTAGLPKPAKPERTLGDVFDDRAADRWERRRDERSDR